MPQGQDLAVDRVQAVERLLQADLPLGADGGLAGRGEAAQQLGRQRGGGRLGQCAAVEADLAAGIAAGGPEVPPVLVHQPLAGQEPEPEEERHRGILEILRQPPGRIEARLLEDVGRVDPALQPPVEPQGDHATQPLAMPAQQLSQSSLIPAHGLLDQPARLTPIGTVGHGRHHISLTGRPAGLGTGLVSRRWVRSAMSAIIPL